MIKSFIDALTRHLGENFGNDYHYYFEDVKQNLTVPCFTIDLLTPLMRSKSPILYDRVMPIVVHYFSDNPQTMKTDSYQMAERISECLEYIPFQNTIIRGENISWEFVDNVLQIFITYKFTTVISKETIENMEEILTNIKPS